MPRDRAIRGVFAAREDESSSGHGDASNASIALARGMRVEDDDARGASDVFDLANVSPLCVTRMSWLGGNRVAGGDGGTFPFYASPTRAVYDPVQRGGEGGCGASTEGMGGADRAPVKVVAVVKSVNGTVRAVAPRVAREDDADGAAMEIDAWEPEVEDGSAGLHEARVRRVLEAESRGVDVGRALAAQAGLARDAPSEAAATTVMTEDAIVIEEAVVESDPEPVCAAAEPVAVREVEDAFERAVAAALRAAAQPTTPVEKQPLDRAVPKRQFEPKLTVSSPEKYEPVAKPVSNAREALDFEAKLELALRAAEAGGDLSAILSGPSTKTVRSPVGTESAESRINYRELGFTKAERKHHALHVAEE